MSEENASPHLRIKTSYSPCLASPIDLLNILLNPPIRMCIQEQKGKLTFSKEMSFPYSFRMLRLNSLLRTGKLENNFLTMTVVPTWRAVFFSATSSPE